MKRNLFLSMASFFILVHASLNQKPLKWSAFLFWAFVFFTPKLCLAQNDLRLKLTPGDIYHYEIVDSFPKGNGNFDVSRNWFDLKVLNKKDSIYTLVANKTRFEILNDGVLTDTRNGYYDIYMFYFSFVNQPIPFEVSILGEVQSISIPDSIIQKKIAESTKNNIHATALLINNYKGYGEYLKTTYQKLFADFSRVNESHDLSNYMNGQIRTSYSVQSKNNQNIEITSESNFEKIDSLQNHGKDTLSSQLESMNSQGIYQLNSSTCMLRAYSGKSKTKYKHPSLYQQDMETRSHITEYNPEEDQGFVLSGTVDNNCQSKKISCSLWNSYINLFSLELEMELHPNQPFYLSRKLQRPMVLSMDVDGISDTRNNFLVEPGDSIHIKLANHQAMLSGKGSLKNMLLQKIIKSLPPVEYDNSLTENAAKLRIDKWISNLENYLLIYQDSLSAWAYDHLKTDIYYYGQTSLIGFYLQKNKGKVNGKSFDLLFPSVDWRNNQAITSMKMQSFTKRYLYRKSLIMKGYDVNRRISPSESYYLGELTLPGAVKYAMLANAVLNAFNHNSIKEAVSLNSDFQSRYKDTEFARLLMEKQNQCIDLSVGTSFPDFIAEDINGKEISSSKFKGKFVKIMFCDLSKDYQVEDFKAYQKMKDELPTSKFELITVFVNKNDSLTKDFIKKNKPKGIIVKNNNWEKEALKKFKINNMSSYFLVNPKGIVVHSGGSSPIEEFVTMFIEMINREKFEVSEATISPRILYGVLGGAILLVLAGWGIFLIVTIRIKRKEKQNRAKLELQLGAVRSQLNPHFLFNAMSSIQYLINNNENNKANVFLSKFASLMRDILFQSESELISLHQELETINTYLELESLRHNFTFEINVEEGVDTFNTEIPAMLIQPFAENAVIHGMDGKKDKGLIQISVLKIDRLKIKIQVTDNGNGLKKQDDSKKDSNGKGLKMTQKRIDLMMENYKNEITFNLVDRLETSDNQSGTIAEIIFDIEN